LFVDACTGDRSESLEGEFAQLYAIAFPKIYRFVRSQAGSLATTQEIVGRVFLKAYCHRRHAPSGDAAMVWIFRIAHTTLIDYWRVDGRHESGYVSLDELAECRDDHANPEERYASKERAALLLRVMQDLADEERELLALKFTAQRTNREIGEILRLSDAAVSMRLLRALRRLKVRLLEMGLP
jgi:RNA polymerase sigma-70 factor (ECF subfamily)